MIVSRYGEMKALHSKASGLRRRDPDNALFYYKQAIEIVKN